MVLLNELAAVEKIGLKSRLCDDEIKIPFGSIHTTKRVEDEDIEC